MSNVTEAKKNVLSLQLNVDDFVPASAEEKESLVKLVISKD